MFLYIEDPKNSTIKLLGIIVMFKKWEDTKLTLKNQYPFYLQVRKKMLKRDYEKTILHDILKTYML